MTKPRSRRLSKTQINLFWGLVTGDHRLKRWKGAKWSVEFLLDGYPCSGGLGVDPRTVKALARAGWIDRDGRPVGHEIEAPSNA